MCELTDRLDLSGWPERSWLICRRTKLRDGDQLSFAEASIDAVEIRKPNDGEVAAIRKERSQRSSCRRCGR